MKMTMMMAVAAAALAANATKVNYTVQTARHYDDVKNYDTAKLRSSFLMEKVFAADEINVTYTMYDRLVYGGAMPVSKELRSTHSRNSRPSISSTAASSASSTLAALAR